MVEQGTGGKIRLLDKETIARISAGEVIERPASVVKELVENALDAGAGRIEVEITSKEGKITGIRVTDDGCGMTQRDAELACVRHATSKITSLDDLPAVSSLGFRGEALASIAAVSRLCLTSRAGKEALAGIRIQYEGGELVLREECGCPPGTTVEVSDLFFNTPVRKKFMRSLAAEMAYITGTMERIILSHPGIFFRVLHNRRTLVSTPGGTVRDAVLYLFGTECEKSLVSVHFSGRFIRVEGVVSRPAFSRQNPYQIFVSVNNRPVQSRPLALAVREGYGTLLPADRFPVAVLDISLDPGLVDVNVHPTKREVRIAREQDVRREISLAVKSALESEVLIPAVEDASRIARQSTIVPPSPGTAYDTVSFSPGTVSEPGGPVFPGQMRMERQSELGVGEDAEESSRDAFLHEMDVLGQLDDTYILASFRGGEDLILVDQHAAHERILFDQLSARDAMQPQSQELLVPVVLDLSPREKSILPDIVPVLGEAGFTIEEFGGGSYAVRAIPVVLGRQVDPGAVRELLSAILAGDEKHEPSRADAIRKVVACRGAIKAGTPLSREQCRTLLNELRQTSHPFSCPHGRPTMVIFRKKDLDGLFLRS
ncbi:MAG: DNA mismatch repair endonuclease MutL [Methanolinea sp.]|jgi:DNA mismatch repair protein MutL|nr:DNA mismatch repair endonuclease MutL [Methanolinea sp.]